MRLDTYLQDIIEKQRGVRISRSYVERLLDNGGVTYLNEVIKKKGFSFDPGKQVPIIDEKKLDNLLSVYKTGKRSDEEADAWDASEMGIELDESRVTRAGDIKPSIVLETDDLLVVNKPPGVSSHPGKGDRGADSMVYQFIKYMREAHKYIPRAGLLHRLDKDTQGLLLFAKNMLTYNEVKNQFEQRQVHKYYLARCIPGTSIPNQLKLAINAYRSKGRGVSSFTAFKSTSEGVEQIMSIQRPVVLDGYIGRRRGTPYMVYTHDTKIADELVGSKPCKSDVYVVSVDSADTVELLFVPHTGRTHQIRAQARYLGCPVKNDRLYGPKDTLGGTLQLCAIAVSLLIKGEKVSIELPIEKILA